MVDKKVFRYIRVRIEHRDDVPGAKVIVPYLDNARQNEPFSTDTIGVFYYADGSLVYENIRTIEQAIMSLM